MFASTFLKSVAATLLLASVSATPDAGRNDRHPVVTDPPRRTTRPTERTTTTTRETCAKEGADCREDRDCCEKGRYICTATPWEGRGKKQCLKAPPRCYGVNRRCVGAPGKPYVPYAPCCDTRNSCEPDAGLGWGSFCKKPSRRPETTRPAEVTRRTEHTHTTERIQSTRRTDGTERTHPTERTERTHPTERTERTRSTGRKEEIRRDY